MSDEPVDPPTYADDDPLEHALAFDEAFYSLEELAKTEPERAEAEFRKLMMLMEQEKAARGAKP